MDEENMFCLLIAPRRVLVKAYRTAYGDPEDCMPTEEELDVPEPTDAEIAAAEELVEAQAELAGFLRTCIHGLEQSGYGRRIETDDIHHGRLPFIGIRLDTEVGTSGESWEGAWLAELLDEVLQSGLYDVSASLGARLICAETALNELGGFYGRNVGRAFAEGLRS